jgi:hypothetical protein
MGNKTQPQHNPPSAGFFSSAHRLINISLIAAYLLAIATISLDLIYFIPK